MNALMHRLAPGQTGCLLAGTYVEDLTVRRGGKRGHPVTLRGAPGVTATLRGRLWIADSANWVTVSHLHLDGVNATRLPSPEITGDHVTFAFDDVTNDHMGGLNDGDGICFAIGDPLYGYGVAWYTTIAHSRIHDCGTSNNHNHGIYVAASHFARIVDNWIYDNADRGIQLYPDAQNTLIRNNVIAGNGEGVIFGSNSEFASSDNVLTHNVIIYSRIRWDVEYYWSGPVGMNNVVTQNCIYGGHEGDVLEPGVGYHAFANVFVKPDFASGSWLSALTGPKACASDAPRSN